MDGGRAMIPQEMSAEIEIRIDELDSVILEQTGESSWEADRNMFHLTVEVDWASEFGRPARRVWAWSVDVWLRGDLVGVAGGTAELDDFDLMVPAMKLWELADRYWGWAPRDVVDDLGGWSEAEQVEKAADEREARR